MMNHPGTATGSSKPRLSVSIITRNSEQRLAQLIAEASCYGDEVVVGVDASSTDRTFEIASQYADVVYHFRLPMEGQLAPARLLALEYATGEWILSLDDDESMEIDFDAILPELIGWGGAANEDTSPSTMKDQRAVTHYYFPRKLVVNAEPCEFLLTPPWFPDWQLRLFRNDPSLAWKPPRPHSGYWVQGVGCFESRASILHFQPLLCGEEERRAKIETYRRAGGSHATDQISLFSEKFARHSAKLRPILERKPRKAPPRIHEAVQELQVTPLPPWNATFIHVSMPASVPIGSTVFAYVLVRNTGKMAWWPHLGGRAPYLTLGYHLLDSHGKMLDFNGERSLMPQVVPPGAEVQFLAQFKAPENEGDYLVEWDLVSENECWFAQCGSAVQRTALQVV